MAGHDTMTAHELARLLLAGPDEAVVHLDDGVLFEIAAAWAGVPLRPSGGVLFTEYADTTEEREAIAAAPRVTILGGGDACPACLGDKRYSPDEPHLPCCPVTRLEPPDV